MLDKPNMTSDSKELVVLLERINFSQRQSSYIIEQYNSIFPHGYIELLEAYGFHIPEKTVPRLY